MRELVFLKCNCVPYATCDGIPYCGVHNCSEQIPAPNLAGRQALCSYGHKLTESNASLPFFRYQPDKQHDDYYCGCFGWD